MKIVFAKPYFEEHKISEDVEQSVSKVANRNEELIQLFPYGLSLNQDPSRPLLLLRDQSGQHTLPVYLTPIEAGVAIQQSNQTLASTPHKVLELLLKSLQIKITKCVFVGIKGHHQYMRIFFDGHPTQNSLRVKAQEAMSLCLQMNVPFFATLQFMNRSRVLSAELDGISKGLEMNPAVLAKTHQYLI